MNQLRWNGNTGWGPRFNNWEKCYQKSSIQVFNAYQWRSCVEAIIRDFESIPKEQKLTIQYEQLVQSPLEIMTIILNFIGTEVPLDFEDKLPTIKGNNFNKWRNGFSLSVIEEIKPVLSPLLDELGYLDEWPW